MACSTEGGGIVVSEVTVREVTVSEVWKGAKRRGRCRRTGTLTEDREIIIWHGV